MEIFGQVMLLATGFALLIFGADWFVFGASRIAARLRIPEIVIGLTVVAFGTSLPEAAVSFAAAAKGSTDLAVGNVIGSNICNVLLILGLTALIRPLSVQKNTVRFEIPFTILITGIVVLTGCFDERLQWYDGLILLLLFALFFGYLILTVRETRRAGKLPAAQLMQKAEAEEKKTLPKSPPSSEKEKPVGTIQRLREICSRHLGLMILLSVGGLGMIIGGSVLCVNSASFLARAAGLSEAVIALTVVALGTSLPELVTSVVATVKGKNDIAIGNIVGSNIFNLLFILGVTALIGPVPFAGRFIVDGLIALGTMVLLFICVLLPKHRLGRVGGGIMLLGMIGYYVYLFIV